MKVAEKKYIISKVSEFNFKGVLEPLFVFNPILEGELLARYTSRPNR